MGVDMEREPHPGVTRVVIMLTSAVCILFLLLTFAVLWGALNSTRNLGDAETGLLLVLGTGVIGLVSAGLGSYFGIDDQVGYRPEVEPEPDFEYEPEVEPETGYEAAPESEVGYEPEPEVEFGYEPEIEIEGEAQPELEPEVEREPEPEPKKKKAV
jgi:hypothetical protein